MKSCILALLLVALTAEAYLPTPGQHEAKWLLPGVSGRGGGRLEGPPAVAESTHDYDVRFYRLDLDLPMTSGAMVARAGIWLKSEIAALDSAVFNFVALVCDSVKLGTSRLAFATDDSTLTVRFGSGIPQGDSAYVVIHYRRIAGTENRGLYWYLKGARPSYLHSICYSMTQPSDSRYWFPCWDHPWDKAEQGCLVSVTVPDSFVACANGVLDSVTTGGGRKTYWWTHRYPIPSYLVNFAASRFAFWRHWFHHEPGDSMEIGYYVWPEDSVEAVESFANVLDMVEFYSDATRFGMYPFVTEKYGMVSVYPFHFGGMEHQTMTTLLRWYIQHQGESVIAHELAHMWFGDAVTCQDWREIWLNEGSASYLDPLWYYHHYGRADFLDAMADYASAFFEADSEGRHPLYDPGLTRLFDWGHTYCKAAWVNHMTRYVEADTVFGEPGVWWQAERAYLDSFRYGNATTEDRRRIHQQVTGVDLRQFYDEWVFQAGFPDYRLNWYGQETGDGWEVVLDLAQDNGQRAPAVFHIPVEVRIATETGDTLVRYDVSTSPQRNTFPLPGRPTGVEFDPGKWLLHRVTVTSGIENELTPGIGVGAPTLHAIAPNPAGGRTRVRFSLPNARKARLAVFDAAGREVAVLHDRRAAAGRHEVAWDAGKLAAGVYLVRLDAGGDRSTQKVVVR